MLTPLSWPEMFSQRECEEIVRLAKARGLRDAGLVRGRRNESIRTARIAWLDDKCDADWVFARMTGTVIAANRQHFNFELNEFAERVQIAFYSADQSGHFDWHVDIGAGAFASRRKLTLVAQLSDPSHYSGGCLELNANGRIEVARTVQGDAVIFPSFVLHRVMEVTDGIRYSLTAWIHGPAFR